MIKLSDFLSHTNAKIIDPEEIGRACAAGKIKSTEKCVCTVCWYYYPFYYEKDTQKAIQNAFEEKDFATLDRIYASVNYEAFPVIDVYSNKLDAFVGTLPLTAETIQYVDGAGNEHG